MIEVREVARRWQAQQGLREIARGTGLDRKTVRRYVDSLKALGVTADAVLDDALVHVIAQRVQMRPAAELSVERVMLGAHRERIVAWLGQKRPLRLTKIATLLARDHGVEVSYATLRRYVLPADLTS